MSVALPIAGYIYLITNTVNGKKYVGYTTQTVPQRWRRHLKDSKRSNSVLHRAIQKYGEANFQVIEIQTVIGSRKDLLAAEISHIAALNSLAPNGYNLTKGGDGVDFSVQIVRDRHRENLHRVRETPEYKDSFVRGRKRMTSNPTWAQSHQNATLARSTNSGWRQAISEAAKRKFSDPVQRESFAKRNRELATTSSWRAAHKEGIQRRSEDPAWQVAHAERSRQAREAYTAKALARDAQCTPEEMARRVQRREYGRMYRLRRKQGG